MSKDKIREARKHIKIRKEKRIGGRKDRKVQRKEQKRKKEVDGDGDGEEDVNMVVMLVVTMMAEIVLFQLFLGF